MAFVSDNISLVLPILRRELLALPRREFFYRNRTWLLAFFGLFVLIGYLIAASSPGSATGLAVFAPLSLVTHMATILVTSNATFELITRERNERTLALVFLTDINGSCFIIGNLLTGMFGTVSLILSMLPFFILVVSLGGVSSEQIVTVFSILISAALLAASMGLAAACAARSRNMGRMILIGLLLVCFVGLPVVHAHCNRTYSLDVISPGFAISSVCYGGEIFRGIVNCVLNILLSVPILIVARIMILRSVIHADRLPVFLSIRNKSKSLSLQWKPFPTPPLVGNPVFWKDFKLNGGGHGASWLKFGISILPQVAISVLLLLNFGLSIFPQYNSFETTVYTTFFLSAAIVLFGSIHGLGGSFLKDRQSRTLEILLTTDLGENEIIAGKVLAVFASLLPWLICMSVLSFPVFLGFVESISYGSGLYLVKIPLLFLDFLALYFKLAVFALWLSLRTRKNNAIGICFLVVLFSSISCQPAIFPFYITRAPIVSPIIDAFIHIAFGVFFLVHLKSTFRSTVLKHMGQE